jgi:hypothetical protein
MIEKAVVHVSRDARGILEDFSARLEKRPEWTSQLRDEVVGELRDVLASRDAAVASEVVRKLEPLVGARSGLALAVERVSGDVAATREMLSVTVHAVRELDRLVKAQSLTIERLSRPWWRRIFG